MQSTVSAGSAKISDRAAASIAKQKSGMRFHDMPGASSLKIVTMMLSAPTVDEKPLKINASAYKSMFSQGSYVRSASGT